LHACLLARHGDGRSTFKIRMPTVGPHKAARSIMKATLLCFAPVQIYGVHAFVRRIGRVCVCVVCRVCDVGKVESKSCASFD